MTAGLGSAGEAFTVGEFDVVVSRNELTHQRQAYTVQPLVMDVLRELARADGEVISRETLINRVWGLEHGADESLSRVISLLRKTFRSAGVEEPYIETISRRGYRLMKPVTWHSPREDHPAPASPTPSTASATTQPSHRARNWSVIGAFVVGLAVATFFIVRGDTLPNAPIAVGEGPPERSVAVMSFEAASGLEEDAYFAEGLSLELLDALAGIEDLKVPSRRAITDVERANAPLAEIAARLGVAYILEGSIRRDDDRLRISSQLVSAEDGAQIWSESYDRRGEDVFEVQEDIARRVATALNSRLVDEGEGLLFDAGTHSPTAFEHYVQGREYLGRRGTWVSRAILNFESAIAEDPNYAQAYAGLATAHSVSHIYLGIPPEIARTRARDWAMKAIELDPTLSEPVAVQGQLAAGEMDWINAVRFLSQATEIDPTDQVAAQWYAEALFYLGYLEASEEKIEQAIAIDPGAAVPYLSAGNVALSLKQPDRAAALYTQAMELGMRITGTPEVEYQRGNFEAAARDIAKAYVVDQIVSEDDYDDLVSFLERLMRHETTVAAEIDRFPTLGIDNDFLLTANIYSGNYERALKLLEDEAAAYHDNLYFLWINSSTDILSHPYFPTFAANAGLLPYWQENGWPDRCAPDGDGGFACR